MFENKIPEETWNIIIKEVDKNSDGKVNLNIKICFSEF